MSNSSVSRLKVRIPEICAAIGIDQNGLASRAGLSQQAISMYSTGKRYPCRKAMISLCDALDCTPGDLFLLMPKPSDQNVFHEM